jgi:hypothetical protein
VRLPCLMRLKSEFLIGPEDDSLLVFMHEVKGKIGVGTVVQGRVTLSFGVNGAVIEVGEKCHHWMIGCFEPCKVTQTADAEISHHINITLTKGTK